MHCPSKLYTTWEDVERGILLPLQQLEHVTLSDNVCPLSPQPPPPTTPPSSLPHYDAYVQWCSKTSCYVDNGDGVLNTLRYLYYHMRCGIFVAVRQNKVVMFCPFANADYRNTWSHKLVFAPGSADAYNTDKATRTRKPKEVYLPVEKWWLNAGILCNVMPENVWGNFHCAELLDMIQCACAEMAVPSCNFFINKRDYPQLKRDVTEPYMLFTGQHFLERERYVSFAPIFSFYTGTAFADFPIPLPEDWKLAREYAVDGVDEKDDDDEAWLAAQPVAVFRGTATGNGISTSTNIRLRLIMESLKSYCVDLLDCKLVGYNFRDKVIRATEETMVVEYLDPKVESLPRLVPFMSLHEQIARYKYIIYADGHCASSRYGSLMASKRTILKIQTEHEEDGGNLWLMYDLVPAIISQVEGVEPNVPLKADHFLIYNDLSNLACTVEFLKGNDACARMVALNAYRKKPSRDALLRCWKTCMETVHKLQANAKSKGTPKGKMWYSPYDPRYAKIGNTAWRNVFTSGSM